MNSNKLGGNYVIVGYSYGSLIALELTHKLEKLNMQGRVVLIDGAPEQIKAIINQQFTSDSQDEVEDNVLLAAMDDLCPAVGGKVCYYVVHSVLINI